MTINISPPPSVPATVWDYGASVPYASAGVGQSLTVTLSPGTDDTIVAVYVAPSPISAGSLVPPYSAPPPGAHLAEVCYNGHASVIVPDTLTRANAHILVARWGGSTAATVAVTGEKAGTGTASIIPSGWTSAAPSFTTSSATFVDVTGCSVSITTTVDCEVFVQVAAQYSGAPSLQGEIRILIGAQTSDVITLDGTNNVEFAAITFRTTGLTAGTYTAKLQARKAGGSAGLTIDNADILATAMQATGGA